jgi:putative ABC transport system permease protein
MKSRRYELALIRVMGGGKMKVFFLVLFEGLIITIIGFIIGFVLSRIGMFVISMYTEDNFHYTFRILEGLRNDFILLGVSLLIGFVVSIIPAVKAMNTDISRTLSK